MYSWVVADMVDEERAAAWLKWDFVERTLHLKPPTSAWVARRLSRITVPFLRSLGCIPVYKGNYDRMVDTLRLSMDVLQQDKFLLVFPEDLLLPADPETHMKPFQRSFARLGEMYNECDWQAAGVLSVGSTPNRGCDGWGAGDVIRSMLWT